jgi:hypothetical protein
LVSLARYSVAVFTRFVNPGTGEINKAQQKQ